MHLLNNPSSEEDLYSAIDYFNQAVEQNPADARAYAGLALGHTTIGHGFNPPDGVWPRARAAAERSVRLDSTLAEGWAALAHLRYLSERDWEGAERAFRRANELNPSLAMNHYHYAWYLAFFGRGEEAFVEHRLAQTIDPLTPRHTVWIPALHWFSGDNVRALGEARSLLEQYPNNATLRYIIAESAARLGRFDEAIEEMEEGVALFPGWTPYLGQYLAWAGRTEEAIHILEQVEAQPANPWNALGLAYIHLFLGNRDEALAWLEREPRHAWAAAIAVYPQFEVYREDPRFQALLRQMNLRIAPGDLAPTALPLLPESTPGSGG